MTIKKEEIDTSIENLITPERLAKGDLEVSHNGKGMIHRAIPMNLTIIKELIRRRAFPHHFEIYGIGYLEMRASYLAPFRARGSVALLEKEALEQLGINVNPTQTSELYRFVQKNLGVDRCKMVQWVVESEERRKPKKNQPAFVEKRVSKVDLYKNCFERLAKCMDEGWELIHDSHKPL